KVINKSLITDEILNKILAAKRAVIWYGGGIIKADASNEALEFAELIGAPVITSQSGKGSIPETHELCIGYFAAFEQTQELLESSDLLISIGTQFRRTDTLNGTLKLPKEHISINNNIEAFNINYTISNGLVADAKEVLLDLIAKISSKVNITDNNYKEEVKNVKYELRQKLYEK